MLSRGSKIKKKTRKRVYNLNSINRAAVVCFSLLCASIIIIIAQSKLLATSLAHWNPASQQQHSEKGIYHHLSCLHNVQHSTAYSIPPPPTPTWPALPLPLPPLKAENLQLLVPQLRHYNEPKSISVTSLLGQVRLWLRPV